MTPVETVLAELRDRGDVKPRGSGWRCLCPAHDDTNPSLDIDEGRDHRVLLCCRSRGCSAASIVGALGLGLRDLFNGTFNSSNLSFDERLVTAYDYRDERGALLFQAVRLTEPKDFRQRRPKAGGGWEWKLGDTRRVLYRLPELLAADTAATVYLVEGEKDADNLAKLGLVATTNPMGAGKWRKEYAEFLRGRPVALLPDNDDPGREHAKTVAASLKGVAASVRVVELPDLPPKGDVSDWLAAGGTAARLTTLVANWQPPPTPTPDEKPKQPELVGWEVILNYFRTHYRPGFRVEDSIFSDRERRQVRRVEACAALPPGLIFDLGQAENAPKFKNAPDEDKLPGFFRKWAGTAWLSLLAELPDEDAAELGTTATELAAEEFRRLVREALLTPIVFGQQIPVGRLVVGQADVTETKLERRPLAEWCRRFAKPGPWRDVRELKCWCKTSTPSEGEIVYKVAIRHELFSQIKSDRRLIEMGSNKFARRCERYGVGKPGGQSERPHGLWALVLDDGFVADLIGSADVEEEGQS
jgi:hypothetical protein